MKLVTLGSEFAALDLYLEIEKVRFGERLIIEKEVESRVLDALVPNLILSTADRERDHTERGRWLPVNFRLTPGPGPRAAARRHRAGPRQRREAKEVERRGRLELTSAPATILWRPADITAMARTRMPGRMGGSPRGLPYSDSEAIL